MSVQTASMNRKIEPSKNATSVSGAGYMLICLPLLCGLALSVYFTNSTFLDNYGLGAWSGVIGVAPLIVGALLTILLGWKTDKGRDLRSFFVESRFELLKVVWPTGQEAIRTTWIVILVVSVLSLLLGGFDFVIQKITHWFLSH